MKEEIKKGDRVPVISIRSLINLFCNFLVSSDILNLGCHYARRCIHFEQVFSILPQQYHAIGIIPVILVVLFQLVRSVFVDLRIHIPEKLLNLL
uniref:Uncharacterized protein n=1 Tax=Populus trichocarpa TaxID=3694 RepID=A0A2K1XNI6_POPTR